MRFNILVVFKEIIRESARTSFASFLSLLVAMPANAKSGAIPVALPAAAPTASQEFDPYDELAALVQDIEKLANDRNEGPEIEQKRALAGVMASSLLAQTEAELASIQAEVKSLAAKKVSPEDPQTSALMQKAQASHLKKQYLMHLIGQQSLGIPTSFLRDPSGPLTKENVVNASLSFPPGGYEAVQNDHPARQKSRVIGGLRSFTNQYATFSISMGLIAMAHLQFVDATQPNALENWERQFTDIVGMAGFGIFMLANHGTIALYQKIRKGVAPTSLINYLGMTAGSVASSLFHDLWADKDVRKCLRNHFDSKAKAVEGACDKAWNTWMSPHNKILQYAPSVISMLASTAIAQGVRKMMTTTGVPQAIERQYLRVVIPGVEMVPKSKVAEYAGRMARAVPGKVVAVGDFVMFLAFDAYLTAEPINRVWQDMRANWVDPKAFADKRLNLHSEILWPKGGVYQPIANALDVEATNPYEAHKYWLEFLNRMQATGWKRPPSPETCIPKGTAEAAKKTERIDPASHMFVSWRPYYFWASGRTKSDTQLACEVNAKPAEFLKRYGEVNQEWRQTILSPFTASQANWMTMINQFMTTYQAAANMADHLAEAKFKAVHKGATEKPDLSREALAKVISMPLPSGDSNEDRPENVNSSFLDNTWLPTPEMVDYVVAGFACGPDPVLKTNGWQSGYFGRILDQFYSFAAKNISSDSYMTTPYGSSLRFIPPKLTNKQRSICQNIDFGLYNQLNYLIFNNYLPSFSSKPVLENPFTGPFTDESGKSYATLAEFVFENLDPSVYKPAGSYSGFAYWWDVHILKPITPVYANYEKVYEKFTKDYYVPLLFDRTFRYGCKVARSKKTKSPAMGSVDNDGFLVATAKRSERSSEGTCRDGSSAYRVANGVFLAIETELRNYLRGLFSLFASTLSAEESEKQKAEFLQIANGLIESVKSTTPEDIRGKDFEDTVKEMSDDAGKLVAMIDARLKSEGDDTAFKKEMLAKFNEEIGKLLSEQAEHAKVFEALSRFNGPSKGAPVQNLNSPKSANPLLRGGR